MANADEKKQKCVDVRLIPVKLYYIAFFFGWASLRPFLTVYYRHLGMSARQSGIIQSAGQFITLSAPAFGLLGDKLRNPKFVWVTCLVGQTAFGMLIGLVMQTDATIQEINFYCNCNGSGNSTIDVRRFDCNSLRSWEGEWIKFAELLVFVLAMQTMVGPTPGIADAFVLEILGESRRGDYGKQRAWGALSWGVAAVTIGFVSSSMSTCGHTNYHIHYYIFGGMLVLSVVAALFVRPEGKIRHQSVRLKRSLVGLFSQPDVVVFLFGLFLSGFVMTIVDNFLFWFLQDLGGHQVVMGLSLLTMCIGEVIIFVPSGWIIKTLGDHAVVLIALLVYGIRFVGYSFLSNPWFVLLIEPLHGVTFGLTKAACASYMRAVSPPDMQTGSQTVANAVTSGLGKGIGNVVAGIVWHRYGPVWTFRGAAAVSVLGAVLFWVMHSVVVRVCGGKRRQLDETKRLLNDDSSATMST